MPKKSGLVLIALGLGLVLLALALVGFNRAQNERARQAAQSLVEQIRQPPPPDPSAQPGSSAPADEQPPQPSALARQDCLGVLEIPALQKELPILSDWNDAKLKIAPCCQFGAAETGDFVIAGHDYKSHFGGLDRLAAGDAVTFTALDGTEYHYQVGQCRILEPTETEAVQNSGYELVLYTCTYTGAQRIAAFCSQVSDPGE